LFGPPEADGSLGFVCDLVFGAWDFNDFQRLSFSVGRQREKTFKTLKDFHNDIAELRQKLLGKLKAISKNAKGGNDGYRHRV
jgi:hypothetical protein